MQHSTREKVLLAFVVASLIFYVFMLLLDTKTITNVSGLETEGVGVYWDSNCARPRSSIDWGTLTPGSLEDIVVYIRNEGDEPIFLVKSEEDWNPSEAPRYLTLLWDYSRQRMNRGEALQITLTLTVASNITGISSFSFDILVTGSDRFPGDVNGNGFVGSDDIIVIQRVENYGTTCPP